MADVLLTADLKLGNQTTFERQIRDIERKAASGINVNGGQPLGKLSAKVTEFDKSLEAANARVVAFGASATIITGVATAIKAMVTESINMQKTLTDINVLLNVSNKSIEAFGNSLIDVAKNTGQSFDEVSKAATELSRQGLAIPEILKRSNDALVLTRLSGLEAARSVETLTAILNSFGKQAGDSTKIVNTLAAVDSKFAVSSKDLAEGLSRTSSVAQDAGVSFNQLVALITTAQQKTARGGAVIGNALKSILTRVGRGENLDQLEKLGVAVKDLDGNALPAEQTLISLSKALDTVSGSQKNAITELIGGVFQVNILKAVTSDLAKANGIYANSLRTANEAGTEASDRNEELNKTLAALTNSAAQNFTKLAAVFGKSVFGPSLQKIFGQFNEFADQIDGKGVGEKIGSGILSGIGNALAGPGLVTGTVLAVKLFGQFSKFTAEALAGITGIGKASQRVQELQAGINQIVSQQPGLEQTLLDKTISLADKEASILSIIEAQVVAKRELAATTEAIASSLAVAGVSTNPRTGSFKVPEGRAAGYVPVSNLHPEAIQNEIIGAKRAGYSIGPQNVRAMQTTIGGKSTTVVYNNKEKVIHDFAGTGEPAIIPPNKSLKDLMGFASGGVPLADFMNIFGKATTPENGGLANITSRKTRGAMIRNLVAMSQPDIPENLLGGDLKRLLAHASPDVLKNLVEKDVIRGVHPNLVNTLFGADGLASFGPIKTNISQKRLSTLPKTTKAFETLSKFLIEDIGLKPKQVANFLFEKAHPSMEAGYHPDSNHISIYQDTLTQGTALSKFGSITKANENIPRFKEAVDRRLGNVVLHEGFHNAFTLKPKKAGKLFNKLASDPSQKGFLIPKTDEEALTYVANKYYKGDVNKAREVYGSFAKEEAMAIQFPRLMGFASGFKPKRFTSIMSGNRGVDIRNENDSLLRVYPDRKNKQYDIGMIESNKKGDAYGFFNSLLTRARKKGYSIYSGDLVQQDVLDSELEGLSPVQQIDKLYPQIRYRRAMASETTTGAFTYIGGKGKSGVFKSLPDLAKVISKIPNFDATKFYPGNIVSKAKGFIPRMYKYAARGLNRDQLIQRARSLGISDAVISKSSTAKLQGLIRATERTPAPPISDADRYQESLRRMELEQASPSRISDLAANSRAASSIPLRESLEAAEYQNPSQRISDQSAGNVRSQSNQAFSSELAARRRVVQESISSRNVAAQTGQTSVDYTDPRNSRRLNQALNANGAPLSRQDAASNYLGSNRIDSLNVSGKVAGPRTPGLLRQAFSGGARGQAFASRAFGASFITPLVGGVLSEFSSNNQVKRGVSDSTNAVGTGLSIAALGGGSPVAIAAGGVVAAFGTLKSVVNNLTPSLDDLKDKIAQASEKRQTEEAGFQNFADAQAEASQLRQNGGSPRDLARSAKRTALAFSNLTGEQKTLLGGDLTTESIEKARDAITTKNAGLASTDKSALLIKKSSDETKNLFGLTFSGFNKATSFLGGADRNKFSGGEKYDADISKSLIDPIDLSKVNTGKLTKIFSQLSTLDPNDPETIRRNLPQLAKAGGINAGNVDSLIQGRGSVTALKDVQDAFKDLIDRANDFADAAEKADKAARQLDSPTVIAQRALATNRTSNRIDLDAFLGGIRQEFQNAFGRNSAQAQLGFRRQGFEGASDITTQFSQERNSHLESLAEINQSFKDKQSQISDQHDSAQDNIAKQSIAIFRDLDSIQGSFSGKAGDFIRSATRDVNQKYGDPNFKSSDFNIADITGIRDVLSKRLGAGDSEPGTDAKTADLLKNIDDLIAANDRMKRSTEELTAQNITSAGQAKGIAQEAYKVAQAIYKQRQIASLFNFDKLNEGSRDTSSFGRLAGAQGNLLQAARITRYGADNRRFTPEGRDAIKREGEENTIAAGSALRDQAREGLVPNRDQVRALLLSKQERTGSGGLLYEDAFSRRAASDPTFAARYKNKQGDADYSIYSNSVINNSEFGSGLRRTEAGIANGNLAAANRDSRARVNAGAQSFLQNFQTYGLNTSQSINPAALGQFKDASSRGDISSLQKLLDQFRSSANTDGSNLIKQFQDVLDLQKASNAEAPEQALRNAQGVTKKDIGDTLTNQTFTQKMNELLNALSAKVGSTQVSAPVTISIQSTAPVDKLMQEVTDKFAKEVAGILTRVVETERQLGIKTPPAVPSTAQ